MIYATCSSSSHGTLSRAQLLCEIGKIGWWIRAKRPNCRFCSYGTFVPEPNFSHPAPKFPPAGDSTLHLLWAKLLCRMRERGGQIRWNRRTGSCCFVGTLSRAQLLCGTGKLGQSMNVEKAHLPLLLPRYSTVQLSPSGLEKQGRRMRWKNSPAEAPTVRLPSRQPASHWSIF